MSKHEQVSRLMSLYNNVLESSVTLTHEIDKIDYFVALFNGPSENMFKMLDCHSIMYKYTLNGSDGVIIIFSIPTQSNIEAVSSSSSKIMELLKIVEDTFVIVNYMKCEDMKTDKFVYFTVFVKMQNKVDSI